MHIQSLLRAALALLGLCIAFVFALPLLGASVFHVGNLVGFIVAALLLVYAAVFHKINRFLSELWALRPGKVLLLFVLFLLLAGILYTTAITVQLARYATRQESDAADAVLVLGCQVHGQEPGPFLRRRIDAAYEYLLAHPQAVVVLSGGMGEGEEISEAACMAKELTRLGIDPNRLLLEEASTSTRENLFNAAQLLRENGYNAATLIVVTNDFHEYRAHLIAQKQGIVTVPWCASTPMPGGTAYWVREILGVTAELVGLNLTKGALLR